MSREEWAAHHRAADRRRARRTSFRAGVIYGIALSIPLWALGIGVVWLAWTSATALIDASARWLS